MHPVNNTAASAGPYYGNSAHHQHSHHPQFGSPQPHHEFASAQQQQPYMSPPGGPYYNNQNTYPYYSTPREQTETEPPSSPPRIKRDDASSNLSMTSTIEETSSVMMMDHPTSNLKKMVVTTVASNQNHQPSESITAEGRQEVISDGRATQNEFTSRVASPTREHLPPKKRKTMSKESVLLMEINKLKSDLGKAELKIKVLQEENERLRNHRDTRHDNMSNARSSTRSQLPRLPFIPDLPNNSPGKGMFDHHRNHHDHHHTKKQHLHPSYQVPIPTRPDKDIVAPSLPSQIPQDVFIQSSHHQRRDAERTGAQPSYHPYSEKYDRQQHDSILRNSSSNSSRGDWMIPSSNNGSSDTPKKISFALSFDANTHGSKDSSRGYRCVSNRGGKAGMSSRPPLASRWKTR